MFLDLLRVSKLSVHTHVYAPKEKHKQTSEEFLSHWYNILPIHFIFCECAHVKFTEIKTGITDDIKNSKSHLIQCLVSDFVH